MPPKKKSKGEENSAKNFTWEDEETELLLEVIKHYKSDKEGEGYDWESIKTKYVEIKDLFVERYPTGDNQIETFPKEDPDKEFSKERVLAKIKSVRQKYRAALDSGRRSGGGRIVAQFYDLCSQIWGGSPATESVDRGIESSLSLSDEYERRDDQLDSTRSETGEESAEMPKETPQPKHKKDLIAHLKDARHKKLRKPIPSDKQMVDIAKEELELKRKMMDHLSVIEKEHSSQMRILTDSLVNLTQAITQSFMPQTHYAAPQPQYHAPQFHMAMPNQIQQSFPNQGQQANQFVETYVNNSGGRSQKQRKRNIENLDENSDEDECDYLRL